MKHTKEIKAINNVYALLCVSLVLGFLPLMEAAFLALLMFTVALIAAYVLRSKATENSLCENHMTYIIRTIWIASLFAVITIALASLYLLPNYDDAALTICVNQVVNSMGSGMTNPAALENHLQPCMDQFISDNKVVFITSTIIAAAPVVIYLGYRMAKGISRAAKGHRIGDVKNWF